jgi:hypothetical protein
MADFTFTSSGGKYADGITLGAYPISNWPAPGEPSGAPVGSATDTATFSSGTCTFEGLTPGAQYWVVKTTTPYAYTAIRVDPVDAGAMGVVVHLADATIVRPTGFAQITWIGSVEPDNMDTYDVWVDTTP